MPFYGIVLLVIIISGFIMAFISVTSMVGYAIGITLGAIVVLSLVRKLGKKASTSSSASKLFYKITKYKATVYHIHSQQPQKASAAIYEDANEYAGLMEILQKQMHFPKLTAEEAAKTAMDTAKDDPLEEKVRVALQYLGSEPKKSIDNL